jgi:tetratricopeptide (TPR) repeat protein/transcriptional regulator with XRE-family HTH domain
MQSSGMLVCKARSQGFFARCGGPSSAGAAAVELERDDGAGDGGACAEFRRAAAAVAADAALTQEELAEAASLSPRSVSDLERGINLTARRETARLLADALGLAGPERALFEAAARGRARPAQVLEARDGMLAGAATATRTLPRDIASFTGREAELGRLTGQVADAAAGGGVVGIHAIGGMAGIGKTAFVVHAAHRLAGRFPDGQMFLPLHAHTPGQRPVDPADGLASLLLASGVAARQIPPGVEARAGRWRDHLAGKKILLVLDDAAGHEQVRPLLPGTPGSLVLITSRRRLTALEDTAAISLDTLAPGNAAALLARLAGRADLAPGAEPAGEITRLCGYLPLAIGMVARQLHHHPSWTAADLASDLAAARERLELMRAENVSVAAAFDLSYQDLPGDQQRLLRRLGVHPGPDIDAYAAAALDDTSLAQARRGLEGLYDQHLLAEPARGRYRLHDLLREYARALAAADDPAGRDAATGRLLDYYLHTAQAASKHIVTRVTARRRPPPVQPPSCSPQISAPGPAAAWLETERANLHAAAGYAAAARLLHAVAIPAATAGFLDTRGHWDQAAVLHLGAMTAARKAGDLVGQADALNDLCAMQRATGDHPAAAASATQALALYHDLGDRTGQARALNNLGIAQRLAGDYLAAAASHRKALELFGELGDRYGQAHALNEIGNLQWLTGEYAAAADSHRQSLELYRDLDDRLGQGDVLTNLGIVQRLTGDYRAAAATQQQALELFGELGDRYGQAHVLNELGALQRLTGDYPAAAASQQQALKLFRDLGDRADQAYAYNDLGIVQWLTGNYAAAADNHRQALELLRDAGDRLGEADVLNDLGELLSQDPDSHQARGYHARALAIARDLGVPLTEARALEGIGRCHLQDGNPSEGTALLRHALTIYQRIGAPAAQRVREALRDQRTKNDNPAPNRKQ